MFINIKLHTDISVLEFLTAYPWKFSLLPFKNIMMKLNSDKWCHLLADLFMIMYQSPLC